MSKRRVVLLRRAEHDLHKAADYIAQHAPKAAERWLNDFYRELASLSTNPERCGLAPGFGLRGLEIRQFIYRSKSGSASRALFVIVDEEVRILRIRRPGQPLLESGDLPPTP